MKYIFCQPAVLKFQWQLDIALTRMQKIGIPMQDVILLFTRHSSKVVKHLTDKFNVETHVYIDKRDNTEYVPSVRPWLWYKYLEEDITREKETYFYLDSDTLLIKRPVTRGYQPDRWLCSDCNSYLNLDYIRQCKNGEEILARMSGIVGVTVESLETINQNSGGAQWVICQPTAAYWSKVYDDSIKIWQYFQNIDTNLQTWTAEMWSQLWNMMYFNIGPMVDHNLDFCWATDPIEDWDKVAIYHDAGVTEKTPELFYKGDYEKKVPFNDDLSFVDSSKCSYNYVQALKEV